MVLRGKQFTTPFRLSDMPSIKVHDWTKDQLDDIKEEEEHSSYDSVIKSLLKEREANRSDSDT